MAPRFREPRLENTRLENTRLEAQEFKIFANQLTITRLIKRTMHGRSPAWDGLPTFVARLDPLVCGKYNGRAGVAAAAMS
jgi:hypothetical protein